MRALKLLFATASVVSAACPYMSGDGPDSQNGPLDRRQEASHDTEKFLSQFYLDDKDSVMTTDVGGPIEDQQSLKAGIRGSVLLEDFIFRQKIQHFDHERVPERAVHARGVGAHGVFTSYRDWRNLTAASFLNAKGKETPVFVRFSTVAGSRGSADSARDVHGFATRLYTDEGNFDIVGNNIPVFFIQDAIQFPDLVHAVKPNPDNEIPQAATAHNTAWDFFSQQPSSMHTLFWAMSGHGIPRSMRHVDGWGIHTFRLVTDQGKSTLVKFRWRTLQGRAGLLWEEAQTLAGKNPDYHRQDLWDAIESGNYPEWELGVQMVDEEDANKFDFDLLDPTKIIPEDMVPFVPLGKMVLNQNPRNYFAETEQVMFQPGHVVRGVDFTEDPLLQGRLYSYLDTQLNRNNGPNFEQLPINRPRVRFHNNNRDGASQAFIHLNTAAYTPNTLAGGHPLQANMTHHRGFFTAPSRKVNGPLTRERSPSFDDVWSQPRLFYNSLTPTERQFLVNAIRFETSHLTSEVVRKNVIIQLNRIDNDLARRVARTIGVEAPTPDPKFYHNKTTVPLGTFGMRLERLDGLTIALLTTGDADDVKIAESLRKEFEKANKKVNVRLVGPVLEPKQGVTVTYSGADGALYDGVIIVGNMVTSDSTYYPNGRPMRIAEDAYLYGKPVGGVGPGGDRAMKAVLAATRARDQSPTQPGVFVSKDVNEGFAKRFLDDGLRENRFLNRFLMDSDADHS
ncbi:catalase B, variant 3 [Blastomyces dermatitidis ATCC 26199]|nr:catalase B [Blastomyces dermatitidis ATCC 26199]EQL29836.1 catalase B, variant 1 [Blastomyces dermatitidis ATCC 26199]EQL29837.1 catalase B, variant 2 [Blastomyces dermatitidis ATCC 26199]EQL29838.1 catalase B, variant 3 [Blastomyces dermatitidis ATCC 26199]